jgi:hypothetical protein
MMGEPRVVVLSKTLMGYMLEAKTTRSVFAWLPETFQLGEMKKIGGTIIYGAPHFSSTTYTKEVFADLGIYLRAFCNADSLAGR